jgi:hypothetical protein
MNAALAGLVLRKTQAAGYTCMCVMTNWAMGIDNQDDLEYAKRIAICVGTLNLSEACSAKAGCAFCGGTGVSREAEDSLAEAGREMRSHWVASWRRDHGPPTFEWGEDALAKRMFRWSACSACGENTEVGALVTRGGIGSLFICCRCCHVLGALASGREKVE